MKKRSEANRWPRQNIRHTPYVKTHVTFHQGIHFYGHQDENRFLIAMKIVIHDFLAYRINNQQFTKISNLVINICARYSEIRADSVFSEVRHLNQSLLSPLSAGIPHKKQNYNAAGDNTMIGIPVGVAGIQTKELSLKFCDFHYL